MTPTMTMMLLMMKTAMAKLFSTSSTSLTYSCLFLFTFISYPLSTNQKGCMKHARVLLVEDLGFVSTDHFQSLCVQVLGSNLHSIPLWNVVPSTPTPIPQAASTRPVPIHLNWVCHSRRHTLRDYRVRQEEVGNPCDQDGSVPCLALCYS
jgi:hypothetical protein